MNSEQVNCCFRKTYKLEIIVAVNIFKETKVGKIISSIKYYADAAKYNVRAKGD